MALIIRSETDDVFVVKKSSRAVIGREAHLEVPLRHPRVSRTHAEVLWDDSVWVIRDLQSANGTFVDGVRIEEATMSASHEVQFGGKNGPRIWVTVTSDAQSGTNTTTAQRKPPTSGEKHGSTPSSTHIPLPLRLLIGRHAENDVLVSDSTVSDYEASINQGPNGRHELVVTGKSKSSTVNGEPISKRSRLTPGDIVSVGSWSMRYTGNALEPLDASGGVTFTARELSVYAGDKVLLENVSFQLRPRTVTAIVGPSGAGKSTLLNALTGRKPANTGEVHIGGVNLYDHYDELKKQIGLVPQADLLHTTLTTGTALDFAAALRFPNKTSRLERESRIDEVLEVLSLSEQRDTRIDRLSGGQRKRASVALELLTEPELLFLDEPTSGLDPGLDRQLMNQLRELANGGRTIVVVTHSVANLDVCDEVMVLGPGGRLAYHGSPHAVLSHFNAKDWAEVFNSLATGEFPRTLASATPDPGLGSEPKEELQTSGSQTWFGSLWFLSLRYLRVIGSDRYFLALLLILPFVLAAVGLSVGADYGLAEGPSATGGLNLQARSLLLVIILGASFIGLSSSIQELVKERTIYERERSIGLSAGAYLTSKMIVLGAVVSVQSSIFISLTLSGRDVPSEGLLFDSARAEILLTGVALSLVSMCAGLLISGLVNSSEVTMPALVLTTMAQVVLSGAVPIRYHLALDIAGFVNPGYWAMNWMGSVVDLNDLAGLENEDKGRFWDAINANAESSLMALIALTAVSIAATRIALAVRER